MAVNSKNELAVKAAGKPPVAAATPASATPASATLASAKLAGATVLVNAMSQPAKPLSPMRTRLPARPGLPAAAPSAAAVEPPTSLAPPSAISPSTPPERGLPERQPPAGIPAPLDPPSMMSTVTPAVPVAVPQPIASPTLNPGGMPPLPKMEKMMKNAEQFMAFSQANVQAMMKSGQIWTAGLQGLSKQMAANAQLALDETVSTMKALTSVKSIKEALELQTSLAKSTVEKAVAGTTQITESSMKLAGETMAPITERMQAAAQTFAISAA